jgi:two-component system, OmpR family, phosphate regulon response regulator PhoB
MMTSEAAGEAEAHQLARAAGCATRPPTRRVMIIDREPQAMQPLHGRLTEAGFEVSVPDGFEDACAALERERPQLVMVDWDLPSVITTHLLSWVRRPSLEGPPRLIALSSFTGEQHVVSAFEQGLDDYIVKPFSVAEVVARAQAVVRSLRTPQPSLDQLEFGPLSFDISGNRVTARNRPVSLRTMELRLLGFLMRHPERAFIREALLERVWGPESRVGLRAVNVTVQRIRRALAPHGCRQYLQTVRGVGYVLSAHAPR